MQTYCLLPTNSMILAKKLHCFIADKLLEHIPFFFAVHMIKKAEIKHRNI